jgi:hypothetical protein
MARGTLVNIFSRGVVASRLHSSPFDLYQGRGALGMERVGVAGRTVFGSIQGDPVNVSAGHARRSLPRSPALSSSPDVVALA